jgi:type II secretory ATPase GspE/PulE/Tfp pilus assembly ATPase PilB-like protein
VQCRGTGYVGRTGIYELMTLDENIRRLIRQQAGAMEVQHLARAAGMQTLRDSALLKLHDGITTTEEVLRVTHAL